MKHPVAAILIVALLTTACTTPGEPPTHPNREDYHDVMRRETAITTSSLATTQLVITYLSQDHITQNYALTILHQSIADLNGVTTDLAQIHPPTQYTIPQHELQTLTTKAAQQLNQLPNHWSNPHAQTTAITTLTHYTNTATTLTNQLLE
jgi:hypothetical protein